MNKYHYTECGLENVFIEGLEPIMDADGDEVIEITCINMLHAMIAEGIVSHKKGISGSELRFLRSEMGMTQSELANLLHVKKLTVGRWERGETTLEGSAETVIRGLAIERLLLKFEASVEELASRSVATGELQEINIRADEGNYELVAA
jgi:DNA-binding transcriptional regulator YiaG